MQVAGQARGGHLQIVGDGGQAGGPCPWRRRTTYAAPAPTASTTSTAGTTHTGSASPLVLLATSLVPSASPGEVGADGCATSVAAVESLADGVGVMLVEVVDSAGCDRTVGLGVVVVLAGVEGEVDGVVDGLVDCWVDGLAEGLVDGDAE
jgi:hypothetical protein